MTISRNRGDLVVNGEQEATSGGSESWWMCVCGIGVEEKVGDAG